MAWSTITSRSRPATHPARARWSSSCTRCAPRVRSVLRVVSVSQPEPLSQACTFLCASHRPAVVVSSCPKLRALVLAALMILEGQHRCVRCSRAQTSIAACLGKLEACGVHTEQLGTTEMHVLQTFAVGLNEALTHKPPPRHGGLEVGTPTGGTRAQTGAPTTPGSKRSAQREPVDARKKLMPELRL
mmetsp:Transcript_4712/g.10722  ORF Transcript_4712/g.10722 Transcript_4712/m.10722 type:complete len:187 (+) Transcript_4712:397-957(+)